jgi:hypothetical protein
MEIILLFEHFRQKLDLKNDIQNHLSQFPYISYSLRDDDRDIIITFNKDVNINYGLGLLDSFEKSVIEKYPLKVKITSTKNLDGDDEFKGKQIIQNIEKVDFPNLGLKNIESKIDTGAATSSISVEKIKIDRQNKKVSFIPLNPKFDGYIGKMITKPIHSEISVQSSNGSETKRCLIQTDVVIKGKTYKTYVSLADRKDLDYGVLIGKDLLVNFLIQPGL